ncbi:MAG: hypothetical protein JWN64_528 [Parcubacteria group bacterium]|nr:hypothetical protein [Parcubacteria group bacterium]
MEKVLTSVEELNQEAATFATGLAPHIDGATLITLSGELGAGKTTFTQAVALALGVTDSVTSPTFVLEKIYELPEGSSFKRLIHIDAYRLSKGSDLTPLGFETRMNDSANLVILEWPERVADGLPTPTAHLTLEVHPDTTRTLTYA